ncbi:hypothetical protein [Rickettsia endosymbiont of Orchestes rusci]|uniref:hypothetical protein n=1 Tax=Rickettsia endosymbiont of Orchestes rusci TaxID=3066250 RepID=UPI00313DE72F
MLLTIHTTTPMGVVAWLIIYRIMVIISTVSYRGLTHYCTNVEKRLCHAVT